MIYMCVFYLQVSGRAAQQVQEQHAAAADLLPALLRPACEEINFSPFRLILRCTKLSCFLSMWNLLMNFNNIFSVISLFIHHFSVSLSISASPDNI